LTVDAFGKSCPAGHAVRKPAACACVAVTVTATAVASAGTPHLPIIETLIRSAAMAANPVLLRLSATRHGITDSSLDVIVAAATRGDSTVVGTNVASNAATVIRAVCRRSVFARRPGIRRG
jgi:hypothetical protein